jgi:hypothetical protein
MVDAAHHAEQPLQQLVECGTTPTTDAATKPQQVQPVTDI